MDLVMGISFQARHYDLGAAATAPKYCLPRRYLQIKAALIGAVFCAFSMAS